MRTNAAQVIGGHLAKLLRYVGHCGLSGRQRCCTGLLYLPERRILDLQGRWS